MPWQALSEDLEKLHSVSILHLDLQSCLSENNTSGIRLINGTCTWNMAVFFSITMWVLPAWKVNVRGKMYISGTLDKTDNYATCMWNCKMISKESLRDSKVDHNAKHPMPNTGNLHKKYCQKASVIWKVQALFGYIFLTVSDWNSSQNCLVYEKASIQNWNFRWVVQRSDAVSESIICK